jgi:hypothetical protein
MENMCSPKAGPFISTTVISVNNRIITFSPVEFRVVDKEFSFLFLN